MGILESSYASQEEIPEGYGDLYAERDGRWQFNGISGLPTQENITRLETAAENERKDHRETKKKLKKWGDLDPDETLATLDRVPALEAAAEGKLDDDAIKELVEKQVTARLKTTTGPLERQITELTTQNAELSTANEKLSASEVDRKMRDKLTPMMKKVQPDHHADVFMWAKQHLEPVRDGESGEIKDFVVKGEVGAVPFEGVVPGLDMAGYLGAILDQRPGYLQPSAGAGSRGSVSVPGGGQNPWSKDGWNVTKQGQIERESPDKAKQLASHAGVDVHATRPRE